MENKLIDYLHFYIGQKMSDGRVIYSVDMEGEIMLLDETHGGISNFRLEWDESIKPVLRHLDDSTTEEDRAYYGIEGSGRKANAIGTFYLIKKGFDVFGLIDANLAVRKQDC